MRPQDEVAMPEHLARLPRDSRGYPITVLTLKLPDGRHDFTSTDPRKWERALSMRTCALCGVALEKKVWFIGGPKCMVNGFFFDLPMHEECAVYALKVCPYLAMPKYLGAKTHLVPEHLRVHLVSADSIKPAFFGLASALEYRAVIVQGDRLVQARKWFEMEYWKDGECIAPRADVSSLSDSRY